MGKGAILTARHTRWRVTPTASPEQLKALGDLPPLIAQLLVNRGIRTRDEADAFLSGSSALLDDPLALPDMRQAVGRIREALAEGETVGVFGDFDVDGVSGTALLTRALSRLGIHPVEPYLPHRVEEGHGLNAGAVRHLHGQGARLLITVDCGVTSPGEVALAASLGIDTIITDHHTPAGELPPAQAIVNPRLPGSRYPFPHLTGVGLALKLAQALLQETGPSWSSGLVELAALGTVTDVAPLLGENRYIVREGLRQLNTTRNPGLQALYRLAGLPRGAVDAESIGWVIGPRLNAAGRLDHAMTSYRLLTATTPEEAQRLAETLEEHNTHRRALTERAMALAHQQLGPPEALGPLLMVGHEEFVPGVIGLVAGRLTDEFYRPAVALSYGETTVTGSCRSISEFSIVDALSECADLFTRFGGHPQAAGFTMPKERVPDLQRRLEALAQQRLGHLDLRPTLDVDAKVPLEQLRGETLRLLRSLAPHGAGNATPVFFTPQVEVLDVHTMGSQGQHLRLRLRDGAAVWNAVAFEQEWIPPTSRGRADIVYSLGVDTWGPEPVLRLTILRLEPSPH